MRHATVEIDKAEGTRFPTSVVDAAGREHSLESIYADAGLKLTVIHDQPDLPLPSAGPDFDLPLLHEYMTRHRRGHRNGWYAHVLIVPNIEYAEGWTICRPMGVMYDFRSADVNNMPREGCGISMRAVGNNELAYLRTLAHELGHVFNLIHPKHELPPRPIGPTIMNQTADLQALGPFPDNIEFAFDEANKEWLSQGPAEYVMPGGRPFTDRPDRGGALIADHAVDVTRGLTLEISTRDGAFELGEPLYLRVTLRNDTKLPIEVNSVLSVVAGTVDVWITTPANREFQFRPAVATCHDPRPVLLPPGAEILASEPIFFGARGHSFPAAGQYRIRATFQSISGKKPVAAVAKSILIDVRAPESAADVDIADALATPSAALYLILRGGAHLRGAERTLSRLIEQAPDRSAAQHAKLAMATQALSTDSFDPLRALALLERVVSDKLDLTHRAEHQRLVALAKECGGDAKGRDGAVDGFSALAERSRPNAAQVIDEMARWVGEFRERAARGKLLGRR